MGVHLKKKIHSNMKISPFLFLGTVYAGTIYIDEKSANEMLESRVKRQLCLNPFGCGPATTAAPKSEEEQQKEITDIYRQMTLDQHLMSRESWGELKESLEANENVDPVIPEMLEKCVSPCQKEDRRENWYSRNGNSQEERKEHQEDMYEKTMDSKYDKRQNPIIVCPKCYQFVPNSIPGKPSLACKLPFEKIGPA